MKILIIIDDPMYRKSLGNFLRDQLKHDVQEVPSIESCLKVVAESSPDIIITENQMPVMDAFDLLEVLSAPETKSRCQVMVLLNENEAYLEANLLEKGADRILPKPVSLDLLAILVDKMERLHKMDTELSRLQNEFDKQVEQRLKNLRNEISALQKDYFAGSGTERIGIFSDTMHQIVNLCKRVHIDRQLSVLITGETGTGKELIAKMIHYGEKKDAGPFISINCSAIPASLFESELFGYERGAFTGSNREGKIGKLEMANGGSIFLDEIGDMPSDLQPKLLRVIQERELYRVGGTKRIQLDLRFICATHKNLEQEITKGSFRQDLFYRISTVFINIPPLRERKEEILPLAQMFLRQISTKKHLPLKFLKQSTVRLMTQYPWHGNIRELQNAMERAYLLADNAEIEPECFPSLIPNTAFNFASSSKQRDMFFEFPIEGLPINNALNQIAKKALALHDHNLSHTAKYLNISLNRLKRILSNTQYSV